MNEQNEEKAENEVTEGSEVSENEAKTPDVLSDVSPDAGPAAGDAPASDDPAFAAALGQSAGQNDPDPAPAPDEAAALRQAFPYLPEAGRAAMREAPRYRELRALGLSAREAALAAFGELPAMGVAGQGKAHLTDPAGRAGLDPLPTMSEEQYATAREVFGDAVTDAELEALFRRVR